MKRIGNEIYIAPKISGNGNIEYALWVDTDGNLYIQITGNEDSGTFSNYFFSVSKYQTNRYSKKALGNLEAYNFRTKKIEIVEDNNNGAFLKAVLQNLLPNNEK